MGVVPAPFWCWFARNANLINFLATIEILMLGSIIESCGDTLDESHMPLGWPMSIDGAVRQFCMHKTATIQELDRMLEEFDLQRSSVEINRNTPQWSHDSVWNQKYMEPRAGWSRLHPATVVERRRTLHQP